MFESVVFFESPAKLRAWLARHHASAQELRVGFYKKGSGRKSITYPEALDLALCYGWIDGIRHSIDAVSYTIRFTPRRSKSKWSAVNLKHFARLQKQKRVKPPGLKAFRARDTKAVPYSFETRRYVSFAPALLQRFKANGPAWAFYQAQPPWFQRTTTHWVMSAKQESTRQRRLKRLIDDCARRRYMAPLKLAKSRR